MFFFFSLPGGGVTDSRMMEGMLQKRKRTLGCPNVCAEEINAKIRYGGITPAPPKKKQNNLEITYFQLQYILPGPHVDIINCTWYHKGNFMRHCYTHTHRFLEHFYMNTIELKRERPAQQSCFVGCGKDWLMLTPLNALNIPTGSDTFTLLTWKQQVDIGGFLFTVNWITLVWVALSLVWFHSNLLQDTTTLRRRQRLEERLLKLDGITRNEEEKGYNIELPGGAVVVSDQVPWCESNCFKVFWSS